MSGVILEDGVQWEHCNHCGGWVRFDEIISGPSPKWPEHPFVDLCPDCAWDLEVDVKINLPTITVYKPVEVG